MNKFRFRVAYLTHACADHSDKPRLAYRIVAADTNNEAREIVRSMGMAGSRYIGMVHEAEVYLDPIN